MVATRSASAILATSCVFPLKKKEEVRAGTRRPGTWARAFRISSERPSEKYSFSGSPLMLTKGRTAMEGPAVATGEACTGAEPPSEEGAAERARS